MRDESSDVSNLPHRRQHEYLRSAQSDLVRQLRLERQVALPEAEGSAYLPVLRQGRQGQDGEVILRGSTMPLGDH
jgi:hypothetical protein